MKILFLTIYAMLFIIIAVIIKVTIRSFRNPITFFSLLWCVVGFVSNLGLREYYLPSDFVNIIIIVGIIVFFISFYIVFNRYPLNIFSGKQRKLRILVTCSGKTPLYTEVRTHKRYKGNVNNNIVLVWNRLLSQ